MPSIHDVCRDEDVNGIIIGGEYESGRLFYDGRPQCQRMWADTKEELIKVLWDQAKEIKERSFEGCYPDRIKWEIRIDE